MFDLSGLQGVSASERVLSQLCRRSFLSLWAHSNLHTDEGFRNGKGSAKELCDVLLVFGEHIVLFSDKHISFSEEKPVEVAWSRWYRRAIESSSKQLYGALNWLTRHPKRVFLDPQCTRPLPISLPDVGVANYHLVAVARGSAAPSIRHRGGMGSLSIDTGIVGTPDVTKIFTVGRSDTRKPFVHILDEVALEVVLTEFDTASDFIAYLVARERLFSGNHVIQAAGEEQLAAAYLLNIDGDKHAFMPPSLQTGNGGTFTFGAGLYSGLREKVEYKRKKQEDESSYFWDRLIESFIRDGDPGLLLIPIQSTNSDLEKGLRFIAAESRFKRRILVGVLRSAFEDTVRRPGEQLVRTFASPQAHERVYIFAIVPKRQDENYEDYRRRRVGLLSAYCQVAPLRFPQTTVFVGMGFDHPTKDYQGGSEDLFVYERPAEFADADLQNLRTLRESLGILSDSLQPQNWSADEFPRAPRMTREAKAQLRKQRRERDREKRRKRRSAKEARRRNRRRK